MWGRSGGHRPGCSNRRVYPSDPDPAGRRWGSGARRRRPLPNRCCFAYFHAYACLTDSRGSPFTCTQPYSHA